MTDDLLQSQEYYPVDYWSLYFPLVFPWFDPGAGEVISISLLPINKASARPNSRPSSRPNNTTSSRTGIIITSRPDQIPGS